MRDLIVHFHIYKNSGSSIDEMLKAKFGKGVKSIEGPTAWSVVDQRALSDFLKKNTQAVAISSHQLRPHLFLGTSGLRVHPIHFFRHPIDRIGSIYAYEKSLPFWSSNIASKVAKKSSLKEYLTWRFEGVSQSVVQNFQVLSLASEETNMRKAKASTTQLQTALHYIRSLKFFGLVERFKDSTIAMGDYLSPTFGKVDFEARKSNQSAGRKLVLEDRILAIEEELGKEFYREILDRNSLDLELYAEACKLFENLQPVHESQRLNVAGS